jgi:ribosomal protein S18 acetylase RimI-like enzyme
VRVAKLGRKYSHVLVAARSGRLVGVLNAAPWPQCQLRIGENLKATPALVRALGSAVPRQLKLVRAWQTHDPREPHWHIRPIGVHPELQGQGIGTTLLESFLEAVDTESLPAYLETDVDRNVALYERFGFRVTAQQNILGINNRFMWRDARKPWRSNHIARTVARLRRGWVGVYVTTSYFSKQVQREVFDDRFPIVLIHDLRIAREVQALLVEEKPTTVTHLLEEIDQTCESRLAVRDAEEVLFTL